MTRAAVQTIRACRRGEMGAGSSGQVLVRRVKKATTGSTASSRYFSTTSGARSCSWVPQTEPSTASPAAGRNSRQWT